ncbi:hypothetical protein GCM10023324_27370 [Streptomyces youssoufiensis]
MAGGVVVGWRPSVAATDRRVADRVIKAIRTTGKQTTNTRVRVNVWLWARVSGMDAVAVRTLNAGNSPAGNGRCGETRHAG